MPLQFWVDRSYNQVDFQVVLRLTRSYCHHMLVCLPHAPPGSYDSCENFAGTDCTLLGPWLPHKKTSSSPATGAKTGSFGKPIDNTVLHQISQTSKGSRGDSWRIIGRCAGCPPGNRHNNTKTPWYCYTCNLFCHPDYMPRLHQKLGKSKKEPNLVIFWVKNNASYRTSSK